MVELENGGPKIVCNECFEEVDFFGVVYEDTIKELILLGWKRIKSYMGDIHYCPSCIGR